MANIREMRTALGDTQIEFVARYHIPFRTIQNFFDFDKANISEALKNSERILDNFDGFLHRSEDFRHSYEKFRFTGDVNKPPFDEVYEIVKAYIKDSLPKEK